MLAAMNDITAPSISLEGKNIWLVQAFPVTGWQALRAKLHLHLLLTLPPMLALVAAAEIVIKPPDYLCRADTACIGAICAFYGGVRAGAESEIAKPEMDE